MKKIFDLMNKRIMTMLCLMTLSACTHLTWSVEPERDFVLLIYMNGSNLESKHQLATDNIESIIRAMTPEVSDDKLTVLLLMGGTRTWHLDRSMPTAKISSDSITYARIGGNGFRPVRSLANRSIGQPSTLSEFVQYGIRELPAKRYGLIFWNHGAGSVTGFGYDESFPNDASLSLAEMGEALRDVEILKSQKLAFIGFDACLMATLETASTVAPYADYMIASQELEPGNGWDYVSFIDSLSRNPMMPCRELCKTIVDTFVDSYEEKEQDPVTLSAVDLSKVHRLAANVAGLSDIKRSKLTGDNQASGAGFFQKISSSRIQTKSFGMPAFTYSGPDMVDVLDFFRNMAEVEEGALIEEIERNVAEAVVYSGRSPNLDKDNICGLSIYFPYYNMKTAQKLTEYYRCGFNEAYYTFVKTFAQELLAGNRNKKPIPVFDSDSTKTLSTEMILNTRKIYSMVLAEKPNGQWVSYGLDGDGVRLNNAGQVEKWDNNRRVMEKWDKSWISIGDKVVSAYMTLSGSQSLMYTIPVYLNNELADLILRYDKENPSGKIDGARRIIDNDIPDKGFIPIRANDTITFLNECFTHQDSLQYIPLETIVVRKKKDLKVNVIPVPKGRYRYGYCLVDFYGRRHYTKFEEYEVQ